MEELEDADRNLEAASVNGSKMPPIAPGVPRLHGNTGGRAALLRAARNTREGDKNAQSFASQS